jgi:hypothetical protein
MAGLLDALFQGRAPAGLLGGGGLADSLSPGRARRRQEEIRKELINRQLMDSMGLEREKFGLQKQQFDFQQQQANRPTVERYKVTDINGEESEQPHVVVRDPKGNVLGVRRLRIEDAPQIGQPGQPGQSPQQQMRTPPPEQLNPYTSRGKPMTESQGKDGAFATRMFLAEEVLQSDPSIIKAGMDSHNKGVAAVAGTVPFGIGRAFMDDKYKQFEGAADNFVNAVLRRESGAVIRDDEFTRTYKDYIPQPNDSEIVLRQKAERRAAITKDFAMAAGRGYRANYHYNEKGEILRRAKSPKEVMAWPKGTRFIDPEGNERIVT